MMMNLSDTADIDVELKNITKRYGNVTAVDNFSLNVPKGSFTTLLGPSGCGKTTLLRIIAGFFDADSGEIRIGGKNQAGIPPEKRSTGMVFQDYALFPHLTARQNLAYGLEIRKIPRKEQEGLVLETAETLGMGELLGRYPAELSGGQQQRLALGRVLILKPKILLMDEPLSNLDAKFRLRLRRELKDIQKRLGITTIYVTHDQEEALSLSDYVAVMNCGRLAEASSPRDLYERPSSRFAADFSGPANFIRKNGRLFLVRPEWLRLSGGAAAGAETIVVEGRVKSADYLGGTVRLYVEARGEEIEADIPASDSLPEAGETVKLEAFRSRELP